jgi:hypothetical protein
VLLGVDGISNFNGLHSRRHDDEVQLYAFDILVLEGEDLRNLPLHLRKNNLARLLARRPEGIFISEFERGEIGPDLFRQSCKFGLEGLGLEAQGPAVPRRPATALDQGEEPKSSGNAKSPGVFLMMKRDDLWCAWVEKPPFSTMKISAEVHDAVMALPPQKRRDRAKVNEAVRAGLKLGPRRSAGSADLHGVPKAKE